MQTHSRDGHSQGCVIDLQSSFDQGGPRLDEYLLESTRRLDEIAEFVSWGETVGRDSRDWMLEQVDFIVETVGNETLELGEELRSNLLQLLLTIANLNEQIRRQDSLTL